MFIDSARILGVSGKEPAQMTIKEEHIVIVAIGIGLISKKLISYPNGVCMKGTRELTFNI